MAITKIEVPELFDFGSDNSAFKLPTGTTADRPTSPSNGEMRFNTTTGYVEYYDTTDTQWWEIDYEALCTTNDPNYPITNLAYYKMSDASDSATHNEFATWDPNLVPTPNLYNGNLRMYGSGGSVANGIGYSNQSVSSGKHYWEHTVTAIGGESSFGIARPSDTGGSHYVVGTTSTSWGLYVNGNIYHNGVNLGAYMSGGFSNGDIIGAELDLDNGTLKFYKNGTGYGNAFTGLTGTFLVAAEWRSTGGANDHITNFGASSWDYNPSTGFVGISEIASYNGTATNVNFNVQGKFGNAGSFNGSSSYIDTNAKIPVSLDFSVSFWINTSSTASQFIFDTKSGYTTNGWRIYINAGAIIYTEGNGVDNATLQTSPSSTYADGNWHHVCITRAAGGTVNMYIDDSRVITNGSVGTYYMTSSVWQNNLQIGKYSGGSSLYLNGSIDQVRIFDSALNASQVTQLYEEIQCVPTIVPSDNFNTVLFTPTTSSSALPVTGVGFQPDFVWAKYRNGTQNHYLVDSVRGNSSLLYSNTTSGAYTASPYVQSFDSDGITYVNNLFNRTGTDTMVAWSWKAGGPAVTIAANTVGNTIASDVSANVDAGFSIVSYTGNATSGATAGHGLSEAPDLIIFKNLSASRTSDAWAVYNSIGGATKQLYLESTTAYGTSTSVFNDTEPTANVFSLGNWNGINYSGDAFIAYAFHSVDGYSKIGSYVGGGATDVPVNLGFRPAFVMLKNATDSGGSDGWVMYDNKRQISAREPQNDNILYANYSLAEQSDDPQRGIEFNSNGFVANQNYNPTNGSGDTIIFMAFAADPT